MMTTHSSPTGTQSIAAPFRAVLTAAVLPLILACGGNEPSSSADAGGTAAGPRATSAAIDPCTLVTSAEASEALGAPVGAAERPKEANIPPRLVTCRYVAPRGQGVAVLSVMVRQGESARESKAGFQSAKGQFASAETVAGIGEDAFLIGNQINVLKGLVYLNITADADVATVKALAQEAVGRIP